MEWQGEWGGVGGRQLSLEDPNVYGEKNTWSEAGCADTGHSGETEQSFKNSTHILPGPESYTASPLRMKFKFLTKYH